MLVGALKRESPRGSFAAARDAFGGDPWNDTSDPRNPMETMRPPSDVMCRSGYVDPRLSHALLAAALCLGVAVSWLAQYQPASRTLRELRERLSQLREQVDHTEQLLDREGGEGAWAEQQQQALAEMKRRLPSGRQIPLLLDQLLERVADAKLGLGNVSQGNLEPAIDAQGQAVALEGVACLRLPVALTVKGRFHSVRALLEELAGSGFPCVVHVRRLRITSVDSPEATVHATVELLLHVLASERHAG